MSAKQRLYASRVAVLVLALVSSYFPLVALPPMWAPVGWFGIAMDPATAVIYYVTPTKSLKGIRPGDRVDLAALSFREREYFYENLEEPPGIGMTIETTRGSTSQTAFVRSFATGHFIDDWFSEFGEKIIAMAYILVAIVLGWGRPNRMLWGLSVFLFRMHDFHMVGTGWPPLAAFVIFAWDFVNALGWSGLIVFAARFPDNRTTATTKNADVLAAAVFVAYLAIGLYEFLPLFTARPIADLSVAFCWFTTFLACSVFAVLCWKLMRATGPSPWRSFGWVVAGYGVGIILGWAGGRVFFQYVLTLSSWPQFWRELLELALPASVAYAMIRHRAFGLGYLANRTLVFGSFAVIAISTIVISVWAASRLTTTIGIGFAMFAALLCGMTIQSSNAIIVRFVDRVFLRRRYEAAIALDRIRDTLRGSRDAKRTTDEIATTLGLASLAVFSRAADGGFVRNAAFGWPPGSAWHLLPDEPLTRTFEDGSAAIVRVPVDDDEIAFPVPDARPHFALALRRGDRVERAIFVGPQRNGANLDRDALRSLCGVFDETVFA